jgi:micrococcal nuclease
MFTYSANVTKVVDGDTIQVDIDLGFGVWYCNQRVRLIGIDTPESRTTDKEEKTRGEISKKKLKELIEMKTVKITTAIDPDDKFGRILGTIITKDGININEWLITNNYAVEYKGQNKELVVEAHKKNAEILRNRGEIK